jgi:hypothetical protein
MLHPRALPGPVGLPPGEEVVPTRVRTVPPGPVRAPAARWTPRPTQASSPGGGHGQAGGLREQRLERGTVAQLLRPEAGHDLALARRVDDPEAVASGLRDDGMAVPDDGVPRRPQPLGDERAVRAAGGQPPHPVRARLADEQVLPVPAHPLRRVERAVLGEHLPVGGADEDPVVARVGHREAGRPGRRARDLPGKRQLARAVRPALEVERARPQDPAARASSTRPSTTRRARRRGPPPRCGTPRGPWRRPRRASATRGRRRRPTCGFRGRRGPGARCASGATAASRRRARPRAGTSGSGSRRRRARRRSAARARAAPPRRAGSSRTPA